jgi:hypothetical protein
MRICLADLPGMKKYVDRKPSQEKNEQRNNKALDNTTLHRADQNKGIRRDTCLNKKCDAGDQ